MGEVERIRASYGASFGGYGPRVNDALDRQPKKHHQDERPHREDALELHEVEGESQVASPEPTSVDPDEHLDLSA